MLWPFGVNAGHSGIGLGENSESNYKEGTV